MVRQAPGGDSKYELLRNASTGGDQSVPPLPHLGWTLPEENKTGTFPQGRQGHLSTVYGVIARDACLRF